MINVAQAALGLTPKTRYFAIFLVIGLGLAGCTDSQDQSSASPDKPISGLVLEDAWARPTPPGRSMSALYGMFINNSDNAITITALSSDRTSGIELHESYMVDGISRMRPLEWPTLAAGAAMELKPGGAHLMLMGITEPMTSDQTIILTVMTSAGEHQFNVRVSP